MRTKTIISTLRATLGDLKKPESVLSSRIDVADRQKTVYRDIAEQYGSLTNGSIPDELCAMIIADSELLSDEAVVYFLPELFRYVIERNGNAIGLCLRMQTVDLTGLSPDQVAVLAVVMQRLAEESRKLEYSDEE